MTERTTATLAAFAFALGLAALAGCKDAASDSTPSSSSPAPAPAEVEAASLPAFDVTDRVVELSCGECQFGLQGTSCDLAVRLDGVAYFVDGKSIDDFGDAHATDGLCNAIRHARVTGRVEGGRFQATTIEMLVDEEEEEAGEEAG